MLALKPGPGFQYQQVASYLRYVRNKARELFLWHFMAYMHVMASDVCDGISFVRVCVVPATVSADASSLIACNLIPSSGQY